MRKINIHFIIILLFLLFYQVIFSPDLQDKVFAIDNQYTNQLLKLNIDKSKSGNDINVTVYSSKPYKIKLNPIKRAEGEYVIFLPETYHSITAKPDTSSAGDSVNDVDVKLVPYVGSNSNNGYTKITIKTKNGNVKLNVNNEIVSHEAPHDSELTKLISTQHKKANITIPKHNAVKSVSPTVSKSSNPIATAKKSQNTAMTGILPKSNTVKKAPTQVKKQKTDDFSKSSKINSTEKQDSTNNSAVEESSNLTNNVISNPFVNETNELNTVTPKDNDISQNIPELQKMPLTESKPDHDSESLQKKSDIPLTSASKSQPQNYLLSGIFPIIIVAALILMISRAMINRRRKEKASYNKKMEEINELNRTENILARIKSQAPPSRRTNESTNSSFSEQNKEEFTGSLPEEHKYQTGFSEYSEYKQESPYNETLPSQEDSLFSNYYSGNTSELSSSTEEAAFNQQNDSSSFENTENDSSLINYQQIYHGVQEENQPVQPSYRDDLDEILKDDFEEELTDNYINEYKGNYRGKYNEIHKDNSKDNPEIDTFEEKIKKDYKAIYENTYKDKPISRNKVKHLAKYEDDLEEKTKSYANNHVQRQIHPDRNNVAVTRKKKKRPVARKKSSPGLALMNEGIKVLDGVEISDNKGLYLINANYDKALVGVIDSNVFVLQDFISLSKPKINIKKVGSNNNKDIFYVQVDSWRNFVTVEANSMSLKK